MIRALIRKDARLLRFYLRSAITAIIACYLVCAGMVVMTSQYQDAAMQSLTSRTFLTLAAGSIYGIGITGFFAALLAGSVFTLGNWLLEQINQRTEFSSDAAKTTSQKLAKIVQRLSLMNEILELQSRTVDDLPFDLGSLRGKVVLLEFWGTHCKPCIADFPALKRIYSANQDQGFEIVAVSLHAAPARIKSFTDEYQLPWLQLCNDKTAGSECNEELVDRFGIQAVPTTLLLDTEGRVVAMGLRPLSSSPERDLEKWLTKLLPWRPESMK